MSNANTLDALAGQFAEPSRVYSPAPIWWWSGEKLEINRLKWQMDQFIAGGVFNVVILNLAPTGPLYGAEADDPEFFSEAWWALFREVCVYARQIGLRIFFYDQIGFSGANLQAGLVRDQPEWAGQWLGSVVAEGQGDLRVECPSEGAPLAAVLLPIDDAGESAGAAQRVPVAGMVASAQAEAHSRLRLIYAVKRGFDYTSAAACARLIDIIHNEYARNAGDFFGDVIVGSFQDELPTMPTWAPHFAEAFEQQAGYDLLDRIECLFEGDDAGARRVRIDAERVRASLVEAAFFKPLFEWHESRGLLCGFDQQGPARAGDPIAAAGLYADYLRTHRWFTAPGSDHHGDAKIHSSLAHLYGRPRVWIEAFHSSGWGGTLEETYDWLLPWLRAGATLYDPHAVYYSTRGGWFEWAPPSTCWRQPYWRHYHLFAKAVTRLCQVLSQGDHVCDIGVLYPTATVQAGITPERVLPLARAAHDAYSALVGSMVWFDVKPGAFDRLRRDYDVLDDDSVQRAEVQEGALVIGNERYCAVVLPACALLLPQTAATLARFVSEGGVLIAVGALPEQIAGENSDGLQQLSAYFAAHPARVLALDDGLDAALTTALAGVPARIDAPVPVLHRRIDNRDVMFVPAAFPRATMMNTRHWLDLDYTFDANHYQRDMQIKVRAAQGAPRLWDPQTGEVRPLHVAQAGEWQVISVPFDSGPAALLVWDGAPATDGAVDPAALSASVLEGPWTAALEPTMDNRFGDLTLPASDGAPALQTWQMRYRIGTNDWRDCVATFGTQGWRFGPYDKSGAPPIAASLDDLQERQGWQPAVYSLSRGIAHDTIHIQWLGPKGRVPQEFLDFGRVRKGQAVRFRTAVWMDNPVAATILLGVAANKRLWVNGQLVDAEAKGYFLSAPIALTAGANLIEFECVAEQNMKLRALWTITTDLSHIQRPEWLTIDDEPVKDSQVTFTRQVDLPFTPSQATFHIGTAGACRLVVNGEEVGRQGGFDPYDGSPRVQRYRVTSLAQGGNTIEVSVQDQGRRMALFVDGIIHGPAGEMLTVMSDAGWSAQRIGRAVMPASLRRRQWIDEFSASDDARENVFGSDIEIGWPQVWRRQHPLPDAHWLEDAPADGNVLRVTSDAFAGQPSETWFEWQVPALATRMHLPVQGEAQLWIDDAPCEITSSGMAVLPAAIQPTRTARLRVLPLRGHSDGAIFSAPIIYDVAEGPITLGAWAAQGLESFAGGVCYRTNFTFDGKADSLQIDLGRVRGTAEVRVNGQPAGARFCSPFRFDITKLARAGGNELEVVVFGTLAPYLRHHSPTHYIFGDQATHGLFGPVTLLSR